MEQITQGAIDYWSRRLPKSTPAMKSKLQRDKEALQREVDERQKRMKTMTRTQRRIKWSREIKRERNRRMMQNAMEFGATPIRCRMIINQVAESSGVPLMDIMSVRRHKKTTRTRQVCMYLLRKHTPMSYPRIARELGGRDHSTIVYGANAVERNFESHADLVKSVENELGLGS